MKMRVAIIGGGAAGMFCAANLDEEKCEVKIFEQNADVLQKVKISGGGRCNVTHACFDPRELAKFYPRGSRELLSVFSKFQPADTIGWFEERGTKLKTEEDNRVFPESNSSQSIIDTITKEVLAKGFEVKTRCAIRDIAYEEEIYKISTSGGVYPADAVVFATGSAPRSLKILENLGHGIVPPVPSLFTFNIQDALLEGLSGTNFEDAEISVPAFKTEESGALLITHWGLSGPAILKLSAWKARELAAQNYRFEILVNFIGENIRGAEEIFLDFRNNHPKKSIGQSKIFNVTHRFWHRVLEISQIKAEKQLSQISKKEIMAMLENLCRKRFSVNGKSTFKEEFVTAGGVELKEINFKTMQSKLLENFFLAGEVLDIDAVTGGFNFQACWSEAWLIAQALNGTV
ncbi:NAD(P)/FAD-dependent oxidoreductase [Cruoricaptor ignavus]|uniref:NAD(P)/FAD-dependent oxidoreductase n=1 Tax=Cruoricaptor ignavus TaxID=1118202 RepID=UPI00370DD5C1